MQTLKTVTVKAHVAVLFELSVAVQVTVLVPTGKQVPDGGRHPTVTPGQLSLAVGVKLTTAHGSLIVAVFAVLSAGQVIVGGVLSVTFTVNEQLGPDVVEQLTVVVPTAKQLPEAGLQVTVPQAPVVVGAG